VPIYTSASDCKGVGNILWCHYVKAFQLFLRILIEICSTTRAPSIQCCFQTREQIKISCCQARRLWGMLQFCLIVFANKFLTKTDRCDAALSWRRYQLLVFVFSGSCLLTSSLRRRRMSMYWSFPPATIPVNYTIEFREMLEATMYVYMNMSYFKGEIRYISSSNVNILRCEVAPSPKYKCTKAELSN
jgi:hypothetical protein